MILEHRLNITKDLEELIQYPDQKFPHVILHTQLNKKIQSYIPLHWHYALQFMYVTQGKINVKIGDHSIKIDKGDGIFINSNVVHEIHDENTDSAFYCWNIGLPNFTEYVSYKYIKRLIEQVDSVPFLILKQVDELHSNILMHIKGAGTSFLNRPMFYELDILSHYYECIKCTIQLFQKQEKQDYYYFDLRVKTCIQFIQQEYQRKISLKEISSLIHMSETETIRLFKRYIGNTPFHYLLNFRLEQSAKALIYTTDNVTQIALTHGFSTTSYFIQCFKDKYHLTPKQFQIEQHQIKNTDA